MKNKIQLLLLILTAFSFQTVQAQEATKQEKNNIIIIYGSDECHHCIDTKAYLTKNAIPFTFYDIDKNPEALKEMLEKLKKANISTSNLGIPVIDKNGEIFTNKGDFNEFLKKLD